MAHASPTASPRFAEAERRHLLKTPGLGPIVIERLEAAGIGSMATLHRLGVETVVCALCTPGTNLAWRNRRNALQQALTSYLHRSGA